MPGLAYQFPEPSNTLSADVGLAQNVSVEMLYASAAPAIG